LIQLLTQFTISRYEHDVRLYDEKSLELQTIFMAFSSSKADQISRDAAAAAAQHHV